MNPNEKGWLKKYLTIRGHKVQSHATFTRLDLSLSGDQFLYHLVQPTGLMYGHTLGLEKWDYPRVFEWDERSRIKILLAESYLQCTRFYFAQNKGVDMRPEDELNLAIPKIKHFYTEIFHQYQRKSKDLLGRKVEDVHHLEYILEQRTSIRTSWDSFWNVFFHNILLFFDLIYFSQWLYQNQQPNAFKNTPGRTEMYMNLLRLISAAAWADGKIDREELSLYHYFLQSAKLPFHRKREAKEYVMQELDLDDIDFEVLDSWILKKYFLELATLVIWSDMKVSRSEQAFLLLLARKLGLGREELEHSQVAIEAFVVEHWQQVHYLQQKESYLIVSERLIQRMNLIVRKNQKRIKKEIAESKELVQLLMKSRKQELTPEEKEKVREQLIDILKTIPTFALFLMPGSFLTLPILLKIIPKNILFPSSFQDDD